MCAERVYGDQAAEKRAQFVREWPCRCIPRCQRPYGRCSNEQPSAYPPHPQPQVLHRLTARYRFGSFSCSCQTASRLQMLTGKKDWRPSDYPLELRVYVYPNPPQLPTPSLSPVSSPHTERKIRPLPLDICLFSIGGCICGNSVVHAALLSMDVLRQLVRAAVEIGGSTVIDGCR